MRCFSDPGKLKSPLPVDVCEKNSEGKVFRQRTSANKCKLESIKRMATEDRLYVGKCKRWLLSSLRLCRPLAEAKISVRQAISVCVTQSCKH